ncbi:MAG: hypothetical protein G01um101470_1089 [Parcubacteria group bacterium Gr01-1014_70]|nr:MAG: hypothetical protein G01um101470_1089 [Parcubacteria group bacterium Gr01-1014_70]
MLRFRIKNKDIFEMIRSGKKRVETRTATAKYRNISSGNSVMFVCGSERFKKIVSKASHFKTIRAMLRVYKIPDIMPSLKSEQELRKAYYSYPNYKIKIQKFGLMAWEFKK